MRRIVFAGSVVLLLTHGAKAQISDITDDPLPEPSSSVEAQVEGNFPGLIGVREVPPGGAIQQQWNDAPEDAGILTIDKPRDFVARVRLREGMATAFTLPKNEVVADYVLADQNHFAVRFSSDQPNILWAWPSAKAGFDTSLHITTKSGEVYTFYLRSETWNSGNIPHLKVRIVDNSPQLGRQSSALLVPQDGDANGNSGEGEGATGEGGEAQIALLPEWILEDDFDPLEIRHDLQWAGDGVLAPEDAFRDNKFTFLYWGDEPRADKWPAVWKVEDGIEKPARVRKSADSRFLIVEHVGKLTLRHGDKTLCVRAEGLVDPGEVSTGDFTVLSEVDEPILKRGPGR